jgi:hypothetical protein
MGMLVKLTRHAGETCRVPGAGPNEAVHLVPLPLQYDFIARQDHGQFPGLV